MCMRQTPSRICSVSRAVRKSSSWTRGSLIIRRSFSGRLLMYSSTCRSISRRGPLHLVPYPGIFLIAVHADEVALLRNPQDMGNVILLLPFPDQPGHNIPVPFAGLLERGEILLCTRRDGIFLRGLFIRLHILPTHRVHFGLMYLLAFLDTN